MELYNLTKILKHNCPIYYKTIPYSLKLRYERQWGIDSEHWHSQAGNSEDELASIDFLLK